MQIGKFNIIISTKFARVCIGAVFIFFTLLIALPFAINNADLKSQIEQTLSQKLEAKVEVKGKVSVSFFPVPKISLSDVAVSGLAIGSQYSSDVTIKYLTIKPSLFSLFGKKIVLNRLIFDSPNFDIKYISKTQNKTESAAENVVKPKAETTESNVKYGVESGNIINHFFNFKQSGEETFDFKNIKSITVKNGSFSKYNEENQLSLSFNKIDFFLKNNLKKQVFNVEGGFMSDDDPTSFVLDINAQNQDESSLMIQSAIVSLTLKGKFSNSNIEDLIKSNFTGKIEATIIDLKAFVSKYISKNNLLYRKINSTKPIKISANIDNKTGNIGIENIVFISELIDGKGKIAVNFVNPKPIIVANFDFAKVDIDGIWFSGALKSTTSAANNENDIAQKFLNTINPPIVPDENKTYVIDKNLNQNDAKPIFHNLDLRASIKIKTANYYKGDVQNININLVTKNDILFLEPLSAEIIGNGALKINGSFESENEIPKFVGKIEIIGKNLQKSLIWLGTSLPNLKPEILGQYILTSDLLMLPSLNVFSNFNLAINDNKNIVSGSLKIDDSTGIPNLTADLKINTLNYEDYFLVNQSPYLSHGSLLKKVLWLNSVDSNRDISLSFDQFIYGGNAFDNKSLRVKFGQGYFELSDLNLSSPTFDLKGSIDVDITDNDPTLNIDITSNNLQYKNDPTAKSLVDQFFSLPDLDEFSGEIKINIKDLTVDNWKANDIKISGDLESGIINFNNFTFKTYKGEAIYKGSLVVKTDKTINGSITLSGVDSGDILSSLMNVENIVGISSLSVVLNSTASSKAEFFKNLNSTGQFMGSNILIKGFGIYELAAKIAQPQKYKAELNNPQKILYDSETVSSFKDVAGAFAIKKGDSDDQFSIKTSSAGINGVISGNMDVESQNFDGNANFIFLSGTRQKPVPINMAVNFKGKSGAIEKSTNLIQVNQYLERVLTPQSQASTSQALTSEIPAAQIPTTPAPAAQTPSSKIEAPVQN